jgi:alpha-beta hydrolase superfamily lysophospholipase
MEEVSELYHEFDSNYILFQAGVDKLVDLFAPLDLEKQCKSKDKTTIYCKDMWHSVFMEDEIDEIWSICVDWLIKRI